MLTNWIEFLDCPTSISTQATELRCVVSYATTEATPSDFVLRVNVKQTNKVGDKITLFGTDLPLVFERGEVVIHDTFRSELDINGANVIILAYITPASDPSYSNRIVKVGRGVPLVANVITPEPTPAPTPAPTLTPTPTPTTTPTITPTTTPTAPPFPTPTVSTQQPTTLSPTPAPSPTTTPAPTPAPTPLELPTRSPSSTAPIEDVCATATDMLSSVVCTNLHTLGLCAQDDISKVKCILTCMECKSVTLSPSASPSTSTSTSPSTSTTRQSTILSTMSPTIASMFPTIATTSVPVTLPPIRTTASTIAAPTLAPSTTLHVTTPQPTLMPSSLTPMLKIIRVGAIHETRAFITVVVKWKVTNANDILKIYIRRDSLDGTGKRVQAIHPMHALSGYAEISVDVQAHFPLDPTAEYTVRAFVSPEMSNALWKDRFLSDQMEVNIATSTTTTTTTIPPTTSTTTTTTSTTTSTSTTTTTSTSTSTSTMTTTTTPLVSSDTSSTSSSTTTPVHPSTNELTEDIAEDIVVTTQSTIETIRITGENTDGGVIDIINTSDASNSVEVLGVPQVTSASTMNVFVMYRVQDVTDVLTVFVKKFSLNGSTKRTSNTHTITSLNGVALVVMNLADFFPIDTTARVTVRVFVSPFASNNEWKDRIAEVEVEAEVALWITSASTISVTSTTEVVDTSQPLTSQPEITTTTDVGDDVDGDDDGGVDIDVDVDGGVRVDVDVNTTTTTEVDIIPTISSKSSAMPELTTATTVTTAAVDVAITNTSGTVGVANDDHTDISDIIDVDDGDKHDDGTITEFEINSAAESNTKSSSTVAIVLPLLAVLALIAAVVFVIHRRKEKEKLANDLKDKFNQNPFEIDHQGLNQFNVEEMNGGIHHDDDLDTNPDDNYHAVSDGGDDNRDYDHDHDHFDADELEYTRVLPQCVPQAMLVKEESSLAKILNSEESDAYDENGKICKDEEGNPLGKRTDSNNSGIWDEETLHEDEDGDGAPPIETQTIAEKLKTLKNADTNHDASTPTPNNETPQLSVPPPSYPVVDADASEQNHLENRSKYWGSEEASSQASNKVSTFRKSDTLKSVTSVGSRGSSYGNGYIDVTGSQVSSRPAVPTPYVSVSSTLSYLQPSTHYSSSDDDDDDANGDVAVADAVANVLHTHNTDNANDDATETTSVGIPFLYETPEISQPADDDITYEEQHQQQEQQQHHHQQHQQQQHDEEEEEQQQQQQQQQHQQQHQQQRQQQQQQQQQHQQPAPRSKSRKKVNFQTEETNRDSRKQSSTATTVRKTSQGSASNTTDVEYSEPKREKDWDLTADAGTLFVEPRIPSANATGVPINQHGRSLPNPSKVIGKTVRAKKKNITASIAADTFTNATWVVKGEHGSHLYDQDSVEKDRNESVLTGIVSPTANNASLVQPGEHGRQVRDPIAEVAESIKGLQGKRVENLTSGKASNATFVEPGKHGRTVPDPLSECGDAIVGLQTNVKASMQSGEIHNATLVERGKFGRQK